MIPIPDPAIVTYNLRALMASMSSCAELLRAYGRPDKADELAGAAGMVDEWIAEIKAEQGKEFP